MRVVQHIPTPWKVYDFGGVQIGHANTGEAVCSMWGNADEGEANAAFIVRAVNSHDKLVEALKAAAASAGFQYMLPEVREKIDAALASLQTQEQSDAS